jgi:hypothetical protein
VNSVDPDQPSILFNDDISIVSPDDLSNNIKVAAIDSQFACLLRQIIETSELPTEQFIGELGILIFSFDASFLSNLPLIPLFIRFVAAAEQCSSLGHTIAICLIECANYSSHVAASNCHKSCHFNVDLYRSE